MRALSKCSLMLSRVSRECSKDEPDWSSPMVQLPFSGGVLRARLRQQDRWIGKFSSLLTDSTAARRPS